MSQSELAAAVGVDKRQIRRNGPARPKHGVNMTGRWVGPGYDGPHPARTDEVTACLRPRERAPIDQRDAGPAASQNQGGDAAGWPSTDHNGIQAAHKVVTPPKVRESRRAKDALR